VFAILAVNGIAFIQAWSMTHFVAGGARTDAPEQLSFAQKLWVVVATTCGAGSLGNAHLGERVYHA
jgi:hypothetical protein